MSYRIIRVAVSTFIITAMACIPQILAAEEGGDFAKSRNRLVHREVFDDPPAAVRAKDRLDARSPAAVVVVGPYISVQVNVDEFGQNIVGDAANEPSIAVNPIFPDNIVIGWRQFDSITSNFRQAGWAFSLDEGQSWTFPGVLTPGLFRSDPVLDSDSSGVIYYQSLQEDFDVDVFKSLNRGMTWEDPVPAFGGDKNWMAVDKSGGLGDGHVYGIWQRFFGCCGQDTFARSTDGAQIFEPPVEVVFRPTFGTMAVGPDGEVYAVGIDGTFFQNFNQFVIAKSNNAKNPFASPTFIGRQVDMGGSMVIGGGPNPGGLLGQANVAVDSSNGSSRGNVYMLASVNPPGADPLDVHLIRSMDGGATWDPPVRVNNDPTNNGAWQWFGAHSVAPNGRIDVIWNDTRNSGQKNIAELFYAYSYDAGTTWLGNIPVSPPFDSFVGFPNQNKIGDYYTLISDETGADVAYAATFNGEQDVYYLRVEFTDNCPFIDVPPGYWAEDAICKIYNAEITTGCSKTPLKYCPQDDVTRDQMAIFLGRGIHGSSFTPPPATGIFDDVPVSYWAAAWIEQFYKDGITTGCWKNPLKYCPTSPVTRAQMAIFLLRSKYDSNYKPPPATGIFDDVPVSYWAAAWIEQLYKEGITTGCKKNPLMYCPESEATRAQMAVFIVKTFGL